MPDERLGCTGTWQCVCGGTGRVEEGPAGATYSVPCPGPPVYLSMHGVRYVAMRAT